jgi:DNA (cytosine-5)-methyltransferase 1
MAQLKMMERRVIVNELALFAGAGGGILGGKLLGWRTVCAVEWDAYARDVLVARQNDGCLNPFPIWDDVQTFDGKPWRGCVDVVSGGFPCQDISAAGKGAGIEGERSSMWKHMARIIGEVRPRFVLVENSPMLVGRGLARVLGDLASMGYDARWGIVGAHHATAPHKRDRIWVLGRNANCNDVGAVGGIRQGEASPTCGIREALADSAMRRCEEQREKPNKAANTGEQSLGIPDTNSNGCNQGRQCVSEAGGNGSFRDTWWATEPDVGRVANGVAARVDRLRCIGNGQVPAVVPLAWEILSKGGHR